MPQSDTGKARIPLNDAKQRILQFIAEESKPPNKYSIAKSGRAASQPTVLAAVDDLEKLQIIRAVRSDKNPRGWTKVSKHYDVEFRGLLLYLAEMVEIGDRIDRIAEKYCSLMPTVFDLWNDIKEAGLSEIAGYRVKGVARLVLAWEKPSQSIQNWNLRRVFMIPFRLDSWSPFFTGLTGQVIPHIIDQRWFDKVYANAKLRPVMIECMKETVERQLKVFQTEMNSVLTDSTNAQTNPHHIELVLHSIKEWEKVATTILTQDRLVTETENAIQDFERANWDIFRVQMRFEPYDGRLSFPVYRFADFTGQRH